MRDGDQILVTRTLKEFDAMLTSVGFIRAHQSHLVNLDSIREFIKSDGGYLVLNDRESSRGQPQAQPCDEGTQQRILTRNRRPRAVFCSFAGPLIRALFPADYEAFTVPIRSPSELIAQHPTDDRADSRMMVINRAEGTIEHHHFRDILGYLDEGDVLITNNTQVFLHAYRQQEKTGATIEVFLLRELNRESLLWDVLVDPARKIRIGNKLYFGENDELVAEVIDNTTSRGRTLRFLFDGTHEEFKQCVYKLGQTPPKYIERDVEATDKERFQTIFAKNEGAVAAPTAGLHFSKQLCKRLELKGVDFAELTLHVGLGTFRNVEVEDLTKHKVDSEMAIIPANTADRVNKAIAEKKRVVAVGTTVMRAIETSVSTYNEPSRMKDGPTASSSRHTISALPTPW